MLLLLQKNIVSTSTAAVNKLTAPLSQYNQMNPAQKKRKADIRRELAARKKAALEKIPILTEKNTTLKEEVAQLKAQIAAHEPPCRREQNLQRQLDAERAKNKTMQDEKKSKKVDDFETQMKRMKAAVKESERHAEESKKKTKVAEWNVQDAIRRVEAANWTNSILK
jgi:hypothetical protein